jgi:hypothetical protein
MGNSRQLHLGRFIMRLRFLGKHSDPGSSPTLWGTDAGQYVIMGFKLDADTLAQVGEIPAGEAAIRVPRELMRYLPKEPRRWRWRRDC